jgi:hypothetical protein
MGYHRDGSQLDLNPFETEMRRRIWWHIIMLDAKCAMISGLSSTWMTNNWDTKKPRNVNDADLYPGSTEPVAERDGPTEMAFVMVVTEMFRFKLEADGSNESRAFEAAMMGQTLDESDPESNTKTIFEKFRTKAAELEELCRYKGWKCTRCSHCHPAYAYESIIRDARSHGGAS